MKFEVGEKVRIVRGIFVGRKGTIKRIDRSYSSPYLVKVDRVERAEHFTARDLKK